MVAGKTEEGSIQGKSRSPGHISKDWSTSFQKLTSNPPCLEDRNQRTLEAEQREIQHRKPEGRPNRSSSSQNNSPRDQQRNKSTSERTFRNNPDRLQHSRQTRACELVKSSARTSLILESSPTNQSQQSLQLKHHCMDDSTEGKSVHAIHRKLSSVKNKSIQSTFRNPDARSQSARPPA